MVSETGSTTGASVSYVALKQEEGKNNQSHDRPVSQQQDTVISMRTPGKLSDEVKREIVGRLWSIDKQERNCCVTFFCGCLAVIPSIFACCVMGFIDFCGSGCQNKAQFTRDMTQTFWEYFLPSKLQQKIDLINEYRKTHFISLSEETYLLDYKNHSSHAETT